MAFKKKTIVTTIDTEAESEEVTLVDRYSGHSSVIFNNFVIEFPEGKAMVSVGTAAKLREQGIIN